MTPPVWMLPRVALTVETIAQLVNEKAEEHQRLEFKREMWGNLDELRKDVVGALNGGGALLLVGVDEQGHRASALPGVEQPQDVAVQIEQAINAGVQPYPLGLEVFAIEIAPGRGVVAIRCPASSRAPFARSTNRQCRFFQRKGQEVLELSVEEVRAAFREGEHLLVASDREWDEVVATSRRKQTGPTLVAQVRPALSSTEIVDPLDGRVRALLANPDRGQPDPSWAESLRAGRQGESLSNKLTISLHGLRVESAFETDRRPRFEIEVRRTGALTFSTSMLHARDWHYSKPPENALSPVSMVVLPVSVAATARELFETLAVPGPFDVRVALLHVGECKLTTAVPWIERKTRSPEEPQWRGHSEGNDILIPRMSVAALDSGEHAFYRPLQRLFQAFGWEGSPEGVFLEDGTLDPKLAKWK